MADDDNDDDDETAPVPTKQVPPEIHCLSSSTPSQLSEPPRSQLYNLLMERNWKEAMMVVEEKPNLAKEWHYGIDNDESTEDPVLWKRLGLHVACSVGAPVGLIELLIELHPTALGAADPHNGSIPLHLACRYCASLQVIRSLIHARTATTKAVDNKGRLPLHYAILSAAPYTVIELLVHHDAAAVLCPDQEGKTPLQYAQYAYPTGSSVIGLLELVWM